MIDLDLVEGIVADEDRCDDLLDIADGVGDAIAEEVGLAVGAMM